MLFISGDFIIQYLCFPVQTQFYKGVVNCNYSKIFHQNAQEKSVTYYTHGASQQDFPRKVLLKAFRTYLAQLCLFLQFCFSSYI